MNEIPARYITYKPSGDSGARGYSTAIEDPYIMECHSIITHFGTCTHCDINAYRNRVEYFVKKYGHEKILVDGNTVLHYAAYYGDVPAIKYLLSLGANKEAKNDKGETPREVAKENVKGLL